MVIFDFILRPFWILFEKETFPDQSHFNHYNTEHVWYSDSTVQVLIFTFSSGEKTKTSDDENVSRRHSSGKNVDRRSTTDSESEESSMEDETVGKSKTSKHANVGQNIFFDKTSKPGPKSKTSKASRQSVSIKEHINKTVVKTPEEKALTIEKITHM